MQPPNSVLFNPFFDLHVHANTDTRGELSPLWRSSTAHQALGPRRVLLIASPPAPRKYTRPATTSAAAPPRHARPSPPPTRPRSSARRRAGTPSPSCVPCCGSGNSVSGKVSVCLEFYGRRAERGTEERKKKSKRWDGGTEKRQDGKGKRKNVNEKVEERRTEER